MILIVYSASNVLLVHTFPSRSTWSYLSGLYLFSAFHWAVTKWFYYLYTNIFIIIFNNIILCIPALIQMIYLFSGQHTNIIIITIYPEC